MTECGQCGDCCENIWVGWTVEDVVTKAERYAMYPDPRTDPDGYRAYVVEHFPDRDDLVDDGEWLIDIRRQAELLSKHWVEEERVEPGEPAIGGTAKVLLVRYSCDAFDPELRTCGIHDDRPPVCEGYPWYDHEPRATSLLSGRCTFNADIPWRRMLPLTPV